MGALEVGGLSKLIAAIDPAIGSAAIESVAESVCGKHDEGEVLSECDPKLCRSCAPALKMQKRA